MPKLLRVAFTALAIAYGSAAYPACFSIYRDSLLIYQSAESPVDMGPPFSETVPAKFGPGATMIFQEWSNFCPSVGHSLMAVGQDNPLQQAVGEQLPSGTSATKASKSMQRSQSVSRTESNTARPLNLPDTIPGAAATSSIPEVLIGPRGGQYYINSNGNKTYISSGGHSRSGRR